MNKFSLKKRIFSLLALIVALSTAHIYPFFEQLDALRDKISTPVLGKPKIDSDTVEQKTGSSNQKGIRKKAASMVGDKTKTKEPSTPIALDVAEMLTQSYFAEGIETPINRIAASATIDTSYKWFGRKISSRQALPKLVQGVLVSSVMFSIHNLAAFFLYPNWLKDRWWMKGFANSLCSSLVMGFASTVFGVSSD